MDPGRRGGRRGRDHQVGCPRVRGARAVRATARRLPLVEIAAALSLPTSSAAALLKTLVTLGYLEYDRSRRHYGPTMRIAALGRWVEASIFGDGTVLAAAHRLHAATGLAAVVAVQSDLQVQYLHLVHRGDVFGAAATPGARRPLTSSAFGLALLSGTPAAELARLLRRINYGRPREDRVDASHLRVALHEVRANGHAFIRDRVRKGHASVAVFVPEIGGGRPMAVGLSGSSDQIAGRRAELVAQLTNALPLRARERA